MLRGGRLTLRHLVHDRLGLVRRLLRAGRREIDAIGSVLRPRRCALRTRRRRAGAAARVGTLGTAELPGATLERLHVGIGQRPLVTPDLDVRVTEDTRAREADLLVLAEVVQRDLVVLPRRLIDEPARFRHVGHAVHLDVPRECAVVSRLGLEAVDVALEIGLELPRHENGSCHKSCLLKRQRRVLGTGPRAPSAVRSRYRKHAPRRSRVVC